MRSSPAPKRALFSSSPRSSGPTPSTASSTFRSCGRSEARRRTAKAASNRSKRSSHMLDNHETTRFISVANGDASADPWGASPSAQPTSDEPYARLELGLTAILTLPGLPVFYYGDEVGLAGGGDPDSRRVMPGEDALSDRQKAVRDLARKLGKLRRCSSALREGARVPIHAEPRVWAYLRGDPAADDFVIVAMHASTGPSSAIIQADNLPPGTYVDVLSGSSVEIGPGASLEVPPLTARVLVPAGSACL
ncbi:MAG: hypothetical protein HOV80_14175 [Polyangiaceae bacterium]|nr:hypothetical protein [Polyangiaceae bacterium]